MGVFLNNPGLQRLLPWDPLYRKDAPWILQEDLRYYSGILGETLMIPCGFQTDFASVPWVFRRILPNDGPYTLAAVVHDYLCQTKKYDYRTAARVLREAAEDLQTPQWQVWLLYYGPLLGGPKW